MAAPLLAAACSSGPDLREVEGIQATIRDVLQEIEIFEPNECASKELFLSNGLKEKGFNGDLPAGSFYGLHYIQTNTVGPNDSLQGTTQLVVTIKEHTQDNGDVVVATESIPCTNF